MKKQNQQKVPKDQTRKIIVSFVIVSLFLHFLIALCFTKYGEYFAITWEQKREQIEEPKIQFVEVAELDRMRGELAEQDKANENKPLKDAKFLSEKNNTVDKETKAAHRGDFQNKKNTQFTEAKAAAAQAREPSVPELKSADMETFSHGDLQAPAKKPKKAQTISDLRLNAVQEMSNTAASDASQTNDYLKDVAIGAETHLNTREFLYYTYFNRIKKKLRQNWEPLIHSRVREMARSGRQVASEINGPKVTRLVITLDDKGGLSKVQISTTSGLLDLDDVAMEALRISAPFPNPPKDLIENGYVRINWDFILES